MPARIGSRTDYTVDEVATRGIEPALSVTAGHWGGTELRPTRIFLWLGPRDTGQKLVIPTGKEPRLLRNGRRRRHLRIGVCQITYLGNPLLTLGMLGYNVIRRGNDETPRTSGRDPDLDRDDSGDRGDGAL